VRKFAEHPKCVGIGECGLDLFKHSQGELDKQLVTWRIQVKLAVELGKALVIHARLVTEENEAIFMGVLKELVPREHPIHLHCYSDSLQCALECCEHWPRLRIGFTGAITFRDDGKGKGTRKGKDGIQGRKVKSTAWSW